MKSPLPLLLLLSGPLLGLSLLHAQSANVNGAANGLGSNAPGAAQLHLFGLIASEAEAGALLVQYETEEQQLLQARLAAYASMQGKSAEDQLKIWRAFIASQSVQLTQHRVLGFRLSYVLKQKREQQMAKKPGSGS